MLREDGKGLLVDMIEEFIDFNINGSPVHKNWDKAMEIISRHIDLIIESMENDIQELEVKRG